MKSFRILMIHNYYQQAGGEDVVFAAEKELLLAKGHDVTVFTDTNLRVDHMGRFRSAKNAVWSNETVNKIETLLEANRPDLVHVHNTWMMLSPSLYSAFQKAKIPVVQTLHNYRLLCPNALFYRDNKICEDCTRVPIPLPGILHKCYRGSAAQTAVVAFMLSYHRAIHTWRDQIDCYIALTDFARGKFVRGGLPADKVVVKPNFIPPPDGRPENDRRFVLYAGRLSPEKGVRTLLNAWEIHARPEILLCIAGDGPERDAVIRTASQKENVKYLGHLNRESLMHSLRQTKFVVVPSLCYENFPMSILEAFSLSTPVIASRIGAMAEIIKEGETGLLFNPGDPADLSTKMDWLWNHPEESARMGRNARVEYEKKYTPDRNYQMLMGIYERVNAGRK